MPESSRRRVAAELVDHERRDQLALLRREQLHVADQAGEHAAAVDVADEQHRALRVEGHLHVDDVLVAQVDLGRAAGALDDDEVVGGAQALVGGGDGGPDLRLVGVVLAHRHVPHGTAEDDDLAAGLRARLEQHRVHVHVRLDAGRARLVRLRAAELAALRRDERVERHVLGLERRHAVAAARVDAAERRGQHALAGVRAGADAHARRGRRGGRTGGRAEAFTARLLCGRGRRDTDGGRRVISVTRSAAASSASRRAAAGGDDLLMGRPRGEGGEDLVAARRARAAGRRAARRAPRGRQAASAERRPGRGPGRGGGGAVLGGGRAAQQAAARDRRAHDAHAGGPQRRQLGALAAALDELDERRRPGRRRGRAAPGRRRPSSCPCRRRCRPAAGRARRRRGRRGRAAQARRPASQASTPAAPASAACAGGRRRRRRAGATPAAPPRSPSRRPAPRRAASRRGRRRRRSPSSPARSAPRWRSSAASSSALVGPCIAIDVARLQAGGRARRQRLRARAARARPGARRPRARPARTRPRSCCRR